MGKKKTFTGEFIKEFKKGLQPDKPKHTKTKIALIGGAIIAAGLAIGSKVGSTE